LIFQVFGATLGQVLIAQFVQGVITGPFFYLVISMGFSFLVLEPCLIFANAFGWSFQTTQKHWVGKTQIAGLLFSFFLFLMQERQSAFLAVASAVLSWQIYHKFYWERYFPKKLFLQIPLIFSPLLLVGLAILEFFAQTPLSLEEYEWALYFFVIFVASRFFSLGRKKEFICASLLLLLLASALFSYIPLLVLSLFLVPMIWFYPYPRSQTAETLLLFTYVGIAVASFLYSL
jgi:hypothetical protein